MSPAQEIVAAAQSWLGTPYRHQGRVKGVGCDCLGLVLGVWREVYGSEPEDFAAYPRDWTSAGEEALLEAAARHCRRKELAEIAAGDLLLIRWRRSLPASHCAIVSKPGRILHAYEGAVVVETALPAQWRRRIAGTFAFPDLET